MPLLNMKKTSGKATKVAVSLDSALYEDLELYCQLLKEHSGEDQAASAVIREMVKEFLSMDKDFVAYKKKGGSPKKSAETVLNGSQPSDAATA